MNWINLRQAMTVRCYRGSAGPGDVYIYALSDSLDDGVRYVGYTSLRPKDRLSWHRRSPTNQGMRLWLRQASKRVRITVLEVVPKDDLDAAERGWIRWFRERGDLLNVDPGGKCRDSRGQMRCFTPGEYRDPKTPEPAPRHSARPRKPRRLESVPFVVAPQAPNRRLVPVDVVTNGRPVRRAELA